MQSIKEAQRNFRQVRPAPSTGRGESPQHAVMFNSHAVTVFSPGTGEEQGGGEGLDETGVTSELNLWTS